MDHQRQTLPVGISLTICCYQSEQRIVSVLEAVKAQHPPDLPWEVVLVDNNCSDGTVRAALQVWGDFPVTLRVITETTPGLIFARQAGFRAARYEYVAFLDDDNIPDDNWLVAVASHFEQFPDSGAVCGANRLETKLQELPPWFHSVQHSWAVANKGSSVCETISLWGAGMVIRHSAWSFLKQCNFEPRCTGRQGLKLTSGEDSESVAAINQAGWKTRYDPSVRLTHQIPADRINMVYARSLYRGFGAASVWLDAYWRAGKPLHGFARLKRSWALQALAESVLAVWESLKLLPFLLRDSSHQPLVQLSCARLWGRLEQLMRVRSSYDQFQVAVATAPWRRRPKAGFVCPSRKDSPQT